MPINPQNQNIGYTVNSISQPLLWTPNSNRNARNLQRFGQGTNRNASNYNIFLDRNERSNYDDKPQRSTMATTSGLRSSSSPAQRGAWMGAPWALGGGAPQDAYNETTQMLFAIGGPGRIRNKRKKPNNNEFNNFLGG